MSRIRRGGFAKRITLLYHFFMYKQNLSDFEKEIEEKHKKRNKKKKKSMKVSGSKVKDLQRIIKDRK